MKDWKEELDKKVNGYCWFQEGGNGGYDFSDIVLFVSSLLEEQRKEVLEGVLKFKPTDEQYNTSTFSMIDFKKGFTSCLEQIKSLIIKQ